MQHQKFAIDFDLVFAFVVAIFQHKTQFSSWKLIKLDYFICILVRLVYRICDGNQMELGRRGNLRTRQAHTHERRKKPQSNNPIGQKSNGYLFYKSYVC